MSKIKSFSVGNGDMFYINHDTSNFTVIDCHLIDDKRDEIMNELRKESNDKDILRFISTHPDEDHIYGIEYFDDKLPINNFYCVDNKATKSVETDSFKHYCKLRDSQKAFKLKKGCERKWMNIEGNNSDGKFIGSADINILWPILSNENFKKALQEANDGKAYNNISPIISYTINKTVIALWFGDLQHNFMESIIDEITLPKAAIVFAPHHSRQSGAIPKKWLEKIKPEVIIVGEAAAKDLDYYNGYNHITQNTAKDITIICENGKAHFYSSNENYTCDFLKKEKLPNLSSGNHVDYYKGTLNL